MESSRTATRRSVLLLGATALLGRSVGRLFAREATSGLGEIAGSCPVATSKFRSRRYIVNATVILGAVPLFYKARVGGALLTLEEGGTDECGVVGLQFGAGSWPERLSGLNRFGMTQELVRVEHCTIAESAYMCFMTSCRETNFSQAQQVFRSTADSLPLTIAQGRSTATASTAKMLHEEVARNLSWADSPQLIDELRKRIAPIAERAAQGSNGSALPTFLYAVHRAVLDPSQNSTAVYAHNAEVYRLKSEARCDDRSGERVLTVRTARLGTHGESEFKLWMTRGADADLPQRIEFRPKSFLKLTLEPDETQSGPVFARLFEEAQS